MPEENFLLVSLKEDKAKKLAQVISNDTSRLILDHLAKKKDSTESDIAKDLKLPLSTVHYNLQHLVEAKLVQADEYHYSAKGKEVLHYSLTNKFVIIAPREASETFVEKLKKLIPVAAIVLAAAGIIQLLSRWLMPRADAGLFQEAMPALRSMPEGLVPPEVLPEMAGKAMDAAPLLAQGVNETFLLANETLNQTFDMAAQEVVQIAPVVQNVIQPNIAVWFLYGAVFAMIIFVVRDLISLRKK
jgi:DNA-binding transcriptional ArsR family regulator